MTKSAVAALTLALCLFVLDVHAQSIVSRLSTLLTEQRPSAPFIPDAAAAEATLTTVAGLFSIELTNLPVAASARTWRGAGSSTPTC